MSPVETVVANPRTQPAIPAALVMMLPLASTTAGAAWGSLLVTCGIRVGIIAACGLAVAASSRRLR